MKAKRRFLLIAWLVVLFIIGLVTWISRRHVQLYKVSILRFEPGSAFRPSAINDNGQIVGIVANRQISRLLLYDPANSIQDLGPGSSVAINNAGQIAGTTTDPNGNKQAFFWDPNDGRQMLGTLDKAQSVASALNNHGQVVGDLYPRPNPPPGTPLAIRQALLPPGRQAFIWDKRDGMRKLFPHKQRESLAISINDASQVIGSAAIGQNHKHCFWDSTEAAISPTLPLTFRLWIMTRAPST